MLQEVKIEGAKVHVFSQPKEGAIIKLDSTYLEYGKTIQVDTGNYVVIAWAPKRELLIKSIHLTEGNYKSIRIKLAYSIEYR